MLFSEIINGRYKVFARQKEDERARNIQVIKYIETLASMTNANIMDWNAKELFGTGTGNKFVDDKNEINRIFFMEIERRASQATTAPGETDLISDAMKTQIKAAEARHIAGLVARETESATRILRDAQRQYKAFEEYIKKSGEHMANARRLSGQGSTVEAQIRAVAAMSFWDFTGIENGHKIVFKTRSDVIVSHKNPSAGIDITLNFGKFKAIYDLNGFALSVYGAGKNMNVRGYPHPHINGSGGICWGSAADAATRMMTSCNFQEPMVLLATLLVNYNKDNPFISMESFAESQGTPEDQIAMLELEERRDASQARMSQLDSLEIDVNMESFDQPEPVTVVEERPSDEARMSDMDRDMQQIQQQIADRLRTSVVGSATSSESFTVTATTSSTTTLNRG